MDCYERALYNHILASQNPDDGMVLYYVTLASGTEKKFGTSTESFWCCTGTGMENHTKYGKNIYHKGSDGSLYINLFIPSVLSWKEKGLELQMETKYPDDGVINFTVKNLPGSGQQFPMNIRHPWWAGSVKLMINGKPMVITSKPGSYLTINRKWRKGDRLQLTFPMKLYTEAMPDNINHKAFLYGPLVLAGALGKEPVMRRDIPVFVAAKNNLESWIKADEDQLNVFYVKANGKQVTLKPLYKVNDEKLAVYWDFFSPQEWQQKQKEFEAERKAEEEMAARTLDVMRLGEMQPERDKDFKGEKTNTGEVDGLRWRDATNGGWFSFVLDTKGEAAAVLQCRYFGADGGGREFDILIEGQKIAAEKLKVQPIPTMYHISYPIPVAMLQGKQSITVRFQALPGTTTGGLFGCRLLKAN